MASSALPEKSVEAIYNGPIFWGLTESTAKTIKRLCESHERLRAELHGAEVMLADFIPEWRLGPCGMKHHAADCDCNGAGCDR